MDVALLLSRIQFGIAAGAHFFFPSLTIGLSILIFIFFLLYMRRKDEVYRHLGNLLVKIFGVGFAAGVGTGIVMVFLIGGNWPKIPEAGGNILGGPLAMEAVFAFFLESIFLSVLLFGEKKISPAMRTLSAFLVMLGTLISAFWILTVNNWMQIPMGYRIENGKIVLDNLVAIVLNWPNIIRFIHTILSTTLVAAGIVLGICAYKFLKGVQKEVFSVAFGISVKVFAVSAILQIIFGTISGEYVAKYQPLKLALMESQWETQKAAPERIIAGIDQENMRNTFEISIPGLLSLLAYRNINAEVKGIKDLINELNIGKEELPSVPLVFWSFRVMVALGFLFVVVGIVAWVLYKTGKIYDTKWLLRLLIILIPAPVVASMTGWIVTEVGRQPWVVYGLLKTVDAIAPLATEEVVFSLVLLSTIYLLIFSSWLFVTIKIVQKGVTPEEVGEKILVER